MPQIPGKSSFRTPKYSAGPKREAGVVTPAIKVKNSGDLDGALLKSDADLAEPGKLNFQKKSYVEYVEKMRELKDGNKRMLKKQLSKQEQAIRAQTRRTSAVLDRIKMRSFEDDTDGLSDRPIESRRGSFPHAQIFSPKRPSSNSVTQPATHPGTLAVPNFIDSIFVRDTRNIKDVIGTTVPTSPDGHLTTPTEGMADGVFHLPN